MKMMMHASFLREGQGDEMPWKGKEREKVCLMLILTVL